MKYRQLALFILLFQFSLNTQAGILQCLKEYWQVQVQNFKQFRDELKNQGLKRFVIKDRKEIDNVYELSDKKFIGLLYKPVQKIPSQWAIQPITELAQIPIKTTTKAAMGESYRFAPFEADFYLSKLEKIILPKDKKLTFIPRLITMVIPAPPIYIYLESKIQAQQEENIVEASKYFIFTKDIYQEYKEGKITEPVAAAMVEQKTLQLNFYHQLINDYISEGGKISDNELTAGILSDPSVLEMVGPLFRDITSYQDKEYLIERGFDISELKNVSDFKTQHRLMILNHIRLAEMNTLHQFLIGSGHFDPKHLAHLKSDANINSLLEDKALSKDEKIYLLDQYIDKKTMFDEWQVIGLKKFIPEVNEYANFEGWSQYFMQKKDLSFVKN